MRRNLLPFKNCYINRPCKNFFKIIKLKYLNAKMGSKHMHSFIFLTARPGISLKLYINFITNYFNSVWGDHICQEETICIY